MPYRNVLTIHLKNVMIIGSLFQKVQNGIKRRLKDSQNSYFNEIENNMVSLTKPFLCLCFSDHVPLVEQNFVKINRKGLSKMISDCFNLYYQYLSMVLIFFSECCIYFLFILLIFQNMLSSKTSPYLYINDIVKFFF